MSSLQKHATRNAGLVGKLVMCRSVVMLVEKAYCDNAHRLPEFLLRDAAGITWNVWWKEFSLVPEEEQDAARAIWELQQD